MIATAASFMQECFAAGYCLAVDAPTGKIVLTESAHADPSRREALEARLRERSMGEAVSAVLSRWTISDQLLLTAARDVSRTGPFRVAPVIRTREHRTAALGWRRG